MTASAQGRNIVLAAGGTGGHIFPAIAVAEELIARGYTVTLVTDKRGKGFGDQLSEVAVHRISASGVSGNAIAKIRGLASLGLGFVQARVLLRRLKPACVIGFGGYPSVPTMVAATSAGLPTLIHEQNAVLGRSNRLVARRVSAIATSFAETAGIAEADLAKAVLTGNPVRAAISAVRDRAYPPIGPNGEGVKLLILGGSQGARVFSDIVPQAVAEMPPALRSRFSITQQCRPEDIDRVRAAYAAIGLHPTLQSFFDDVPARMSAAHIVITRAGASTISELAEVGRPAILVPYPHAMDDHQTANARALETLGGAWLMPEAALTPEALILKLETFVNFPQKLIDAAATMNSTGGRDAAAALADRIEALAGYDGNGDTGRSAPASTSRGIAA